MIDNFLGLFDGDKCKIPWEAMQIFTAFASSNNIRGSTAALQMLIPGVILMLCNVMGLEMNSGRLSKGCPSEAMIVECERRYAVECYLGACEQMIKDKAEDLFLLVDAGNKSGLEHLAKVISWASFDDDGNRIVRHFCLDGDVSGKRAQDVAGAVEKSIKTLWEVLPFEPKLKALTADNGGGGAAKGIFEILKDSEVMDSFMARFIRCLMHALNIMLQKAMDFTVGSQGIKKDTCVQMSYLCIQLYCAIKEAGGIALVDEYWKVATADLIYNKELRSEIKDRIPFAYEDLKDNVDEFRNAVESIDLDDLQEAFNQESDEDESDEDDSGELNESDKDKDESEQSIDGNPNINAEVAGLLKSLTRGLR